MKMMHFAIFFFLAFQTSFAQKEDSSLFFPSLTDYLLHTTTDNERTLTENNCHGIMRSRSRHSTYQDTDGPYLEQMEINKFLLRCVRGDPFPGLHETTMTMTGKQYLKHNLDWFSTFQSNFTNELLMMNRPESETGSQVTFVLDRVDDPGYPPSTVRGRGSYFYATIHGLEHFADQIEYLVRDAKKLDYSFLELSYVIRHILTPAIAKAVSGPECVYIEATNYVECKDNVRRAPYILSYEMARLLMGTHNRLIHMPAQLERSVMHPYALNPTLDFNKLEEGFLRGSVITIDNLLTPMALHQLYSFAMEATIFFDAKKSYVGAYFDEGLSESLWLMYLVRELTIKLPRLLNDAPLSTAWFYKYDSQESLAGGIGIHADQAKVNMNIWLTPDEANLNKETGGLIIYDKAPPQEEVLGEGFDKWNNDLFETDRAIWLIENNAKNVSVPYRQNRCALFDSKRLHETAPYEFRAGYANRRINLTLLFGREAPKDIQLSNNVEFV